MEAAGIWDVGGFGTLEDLVCRGIWFGTSGDLVWNVGGFGTSGDSENQQVGSWEIRGL